jgi:hypothetical protein
MENFLRKFKILLNTSLGMKTQKKMSVKIETFDNDFTSEDVGRLFWRVGYNGVLTQLQIHEVKENSDAVLRIGGLSDMSNNDYKIRETVEYMGSSTYGVDTIRKKLR